MTEAVAEMPRTTPGQPLAGADCIVDLLLLSLGAEVLFHVGDFDTMTDTIARPFLSLYNHVHPCTSALRGDYVSIVESAAKVSQLRDLVYA